MKIFVKWLVVTASTGLLCAALTFTLGDEPKRDLPFKPTVGFVGPDPNQRSALFELLRDDQIQQELGLDDVQVDAALKISDDYKEEMRVYLDSVRIAGKTLDQVVYQRLRAERSEEAEQAIEEILTPAQIQRLRQLAFRIEVSRIGLPTALVFGRLANEVGVYENQKHSLLSKGNAIVERARQQVQVILRQAEKDILAELSKEQRNNAAEALGDYFYHEPVSQSKAIRQQSEAFLKSHN